MKELRLADILTRLGILIAIAGLVVVLADIRDALKSIASSQAVTQHYERARLMEGER